MDHDGAGHKPKPQPSYVCTLRGPARCEPCRHMVATEVEYSREEETGHARARTGASIHEMMLLANSGHLDQSSTLATRSLGEPSNPAVPGSCQPEETSLTEMARLNHWATVLAEEALQLPVTLIPGTPVLTTMDSMVAGFVGSFILTSLPCVATRLKTAARAEGEMPYSTDVHAIHCARCGQTPTTAMILRDGLYWHASCWHEGARLLANAERIARSLTPPLGIPAPHS